MYGPTLKSMLLFLTTGHTSKVPITSWPALYLLDVTEEGHTPQNPVVRIGSMGRSKGGSQIHGSDVGEVGAPRLFVDGTRIHLGVLDVFSHVDGVEVNDGKRSKEHLGQWFHKLASPPVPASSIQEQTMYVDPLGGRMVDVFLHELGDIVF